MRIPIRYQFMLPLLAVAVASLVAVGVINARVATLQTRARIEKQLKGVVGVLADSSFPLTDSVLRQMGGLARSEFVLTGTSGSRIASSLPGDIDRLDADGLTAQRIEDVTLGPAIRFGSNGYFHSSLWVERRPQVAEPRILHVLFPQDEFNAAWRTTFLPPLLVGVATIISVALVTHLVASRLSHVFRGLADEVKRLAKGDFSEVTKPAWNDETRDLAIAVNQTASQLSEYEAEIRRTEQLRTVAMLGAGLAHEMRNAATGCRMAVDLHAEGCQVDAGDDSLEVAKRQLYLMESRLQRFLQLGKKASESNAEDIDFSQLVGELVSLVRPAARHVGVHVQWHKPVDGVTVHADADALGQAIMNLLLNAVDAASKSRALANRAGYVSVEMRCNCDESELIVADSGDGPNSDVANSVFEPFVTDKSEGVGLGLAVAKRVVESGGGRIGWNRDGGRTLFRIRMPLIPNP